MKATRYKQSGAARKKARRVAALLSALVLCVFSFAACGEDRMTIEDVKEVLPDLVEKSFVLNEIYFGEGFPPLADAELPANGYYYADGAHYDFYSIEQIKEATEKVFTPEYCMVLYAAAFDGVSDDSGTVAPRYTEGETGLMQSMQAKVYALSARTYDYDTAVLKKRGSDRATVQVNTYADGVMQAVELILVRTAVTPGDPAGGYVYRLDSPTY